MPTPTDSNVNPAAKPLCYALVGISIGVAAWLFRSGYSPAPVWVAMAIPVVALVPLRVFSGVALFVPRKSKQANVGAAYFWSVAILAGYALISWRVMEWGNFWPPFVLMFAAISAVSFLLAWRALRSAFAAVWNLLLCAAYAYGAIVALNGVLDTSPAVTCHATVLGKYTTHGRSTHYHLTLSPWGPRAVNNSVTVGSNFYDEHPIGGAVTIDVRGGFFHIPYFFVR